MRTFHVLDVWSVPVKKGRHRRFEEARKLKQSGPGAFLSRAEPAARTPTEDDEYADIAARYGVEFDDDDEEEEDEES